MSDEQQVPAMREETRVNAMRRLRGALLVAVLWAAFACLRPNAAPTAEGAQLPDDVQSLAFSPDGRTPAAATSGGHPIIWDLARKPCRRVSAVAARRVAPTVAALISLAGAGRTTGSPAIVGGCDLRCVPTPVRCTLRNRGERPDATGVVRFQWKNRAGTRYATDMAPSHGWIFRTSGVRLESVPLTSQRSGIIVSVVFEGGSGSSFLATLVELSPDQRSARRLGQIQGELPGGYMFLPRQHALLSWATVWRPGEAHDGPHRFSIAAYQIGSRGLVRRWIEITRHAYPYHLNSESWYRTTPQSDPLREVGLRWPSQWTEKWRSRASYGVRMF